ncbi:MAG: hypothetical protein JWM86_850 [Thermoleophilia bacterium]|nr:hypothetical protein [Thermoleophilia bacterium]
MPAPTPATVRIGCSGWQYRHWDRTFYPAEVPKSGQLSFYAHHFDTVEVNSSFYRLPKAEAVERWLTQVPEDFVFSIKGSKFITQNKKLRDFGEHAPLLYERIASLLGTPRMGPVLWQLPEGWKRDHGRLVDALDQLPSGRHAFEFRHASWFVDDTLAALAEHDVALVIGDHVERPYQTRALTTDWTFVRFHYGHDLGTGAYSDRELDDWAAFIDGARARGDVFAYFNNDWNCYALHEAAKLRALLGVGAGLETPCTSPAPPPRATRARS